MAIVQAETTPGTQTTAWYTTVSGATTVDTGVTESGNATLKLDTSSPAANSIATRTAVMADAGRRVTRYFRISALPAAGTFAHLIQVQTSGGTTVMSVALDSNGNLVLRVGAGSAGAAGATTLSVNTWYRVSLSYIVSTTTSWSAKVYLGQAGDSPAYSGALEMSRTNADATLSATASERVLCSLLSTIGANVTMNVTHTVIDDSTDAALPDIGNDKITAKLPTTTTTNNFDTTVGTGAVNERPVSTTNGRSHAATTDVDQDYEIQAASVGDADLTGATIVGYVGWIWAELSSLTGTPLSKIIVNGARIGTSWDPSAANTAQLFTTVATSSTYPANANGKNIGSSSSTIAADTKLWDCGVIVVYTPATAAEPVPPGLGPDISMTLDMQAMTQTVGW